MAACTASTTSALTFGEALTTRETVDRETPASAATISRVGAERAEPASIVMLRSLLRRRARFAHAAVADDAPVAAPARLDRALLRGVVDAHEPEALVVAPRPLVVVHERPVEVAAHVDAHVDRVEH